MHISEIIKDYGGTLEAIHLYFDEKVIGAPDDMTDSWWRYTAYSNLGILEFDDQPFGEDIESMYREDAQIVCEKKDYTLVQIFSDMGDCCMVILDNTKRIP